MFVAVIDSSQVGYHLIEQQVGNEVTVVTRRGIVFVNTESQQSSVVCSSSAMEVALLSFFCMCSVMVGIK